MPERAGQVDGHRIDADQQVETLEDRGRPAKIAQHTPQRQDPLRVKPCRVDAVVFVLHADQLHARYPAERSEIGG